MKKIAILVCLLSTACQAQNYPTAYPTAKKSTRKPAVSDPSQVLPTGTEYTDKNGEQWKVTAPGQKYNITDRPRDPATGRLYRQGDRINATKIGTGYPGKPSINPSSSKQGYPGSSNYPGQP